MRPNHLSAGVSAGAIVTDHEGRVLLVKPTYKPGWNLPGGHLDEGERPREACARELREEVGLDLEVGRLLVSAFISPPGRPAHAYYLFECGQLTAGEEQSIRLQEGELSEYRFSAPDDIPESDIPPLARKMWEAALIARAEGRLLYVEV
ncbi:MULTISPECIES: NUDIX domain-containing protein [Streptomycetaceae]|uniref:NUDIX domain-containing protein n=1 Tax=Streptomycetaceae TaxID=2062 RepID=UPI00379141EB